MSSPDCFVPRSALGHSLLPSMSYLVLCYLLVLWVVVVSFCSQSLIALSKDSVHFLDSRQTQASSRPASWFTCSPCSPRHVSVSPPATPIPPTDYANSIPTQLSIVLLINLFQPSLCLLLDLKQHYLSITAYFVRKIHWGYVRWGWTSNSMQFYIYTKRLFYVWHPLQFN